MSLNLNNQQLKILLYLVRKEMNGITGDRGYSELYELKKLLEEELKK